MFLKGVYCLVQETDLYPPASQNRTRVLLVFILGTPGDRKETQGVSNSELEFSAWRTFWQGAIRENLLYTERALPEYAKMKGLFMCHSSNYSIIHLLIFNKYLLNGYHFSLNFCNGITHIQQNYTFNFNVNRASDIITFVLTAGVSLKKKKKVANFLKCVTGW